MDPSITIMLRNSRNYIKTDGLMKLIRSVSDMLVKSWVVGEKGCTIGVELVAGVALIRFV